MLYGKNEVENNLGGSGPLILPQLETDFDDSVNFTSDTHTCKPNVQDFVGESRPKGPLRLHVLWLFFAFQPAFPLHRGKKKEL